MKIVKGMLVSVSVLLCWASIATFAMAPNTSAEIYTWRDERGVLHFGDKKIDGIEQQKVETEKYRSNWQKYVIDIHDVDQVLTAEEKKRISKDVNGNLTRFCTHRFVI